MVAEAEGNQISTDTHFYEVEQTGGVPFQPAPSIEEPPPTKWWVAVVHRLNRPVFRHVGSALMLGAIALLVFLAIQNQNQPQDAAGDQAGEEQAAGFADLEPGASGQTDEARTSGASQSSGNSLPSEPASGGASPSESGSSANADRFTASNSGGEPDGSNGDENDPSASATTVIDDDGSEPETSTAPNNPAQNNAGPNNPVSNSAGPNNAGPNNAGPNNAAPNDNGPASVEPGQNENNNDPQGGPATQVPQQTQSKPSPGVVKPTVEAISPGAITNDDPPRQTPTSITLRASGTPQPLDYQYRIYIFEGNVWQLDRTSSWRGNQWAVDVSPYEGRDIRWTVTGRNEVGMLSDESDPRYVGVDSAPVPAETTSGVLSANGSFENSAVKPNESVELQSDQVPGWTGGSGRIFLRGSGFRGIDASKGSTYLVLARAHSVEQSFATVPGETIEWSVTHRSGKGGGSAIISMGPETGSTRNQSQLTSNTAWVKQSGAYTVPAGQTTTRFVIIGTGAETLIDNVRLVRN